ncbi:MAG: DUF362 domain-containing protein [Promethearchaeota archaeon]
MIGIVRCPPDSVEGAREAAGRLLDLLNYGPSKGEVFLKPNMVDAAPASEGVVTDPAVVAGLALALRDRGAKSFLVADGSGYYANEERLFERLVKRSGYGEMVEALRREYGLDVTLENLEWVEREEVDWEFGKLQVPVACRTHAYVNVAKMKTHVHTLVTLSTKNQKGLLLLADKKMFHLKALHEYIRALGRLEVTKPELAVVDATRALEGTGPFTQLFDQTAVREPGLLFGGRDMAEVDNACCQYVGVPVGEVEHLEEAAVEVAPGSAPLVPADPPFRRPDPLLKSAVGNIYRIINEHACTSCQMATGRLLNKLTYDKELKDEVREFEERYPKVYLVLGRTEPRDVPEDGPVICFGNCTKKLSKQVRGIHVPGCPPDYLEALNLMLTLGKSVGKK